MENGLKLRVKIMGEIKKLNTNKNSIFQKVIEDILSCRLLPLGQWLSHVGRDPCGVSNDPSWGHILDILHSRGFHYDSQQKHHYRYKAATQQCYSWGSPQHEELCGSENHCTSER